MLKFPQEYFEDEVIDGFFVPALMKQSWGVALDILEEIDRVCKKHSLKYYADWGSLLAAVRHQGNIPWDDDIDICMIRADYERLLEISKTEFSEGFEIYNNDNRDNHWLFLARVINKNRSCFEEEHLKRFHNFPYIGSVDIFILDYWFEDADKRQEQKDDFYFTYALAEHAEEINKIDEAVEFRLRHIEAITGESIDRSLCGVELKRRLYSLCEQIMARCSADETNFVSQLVPFGFTHRKCFPKAAYADTISLPYENFSIEAPIFYEEMLRKRYGRYCRIAKQWYGHDYPHYKKQRDTLNDLIDTSFLDYKFKREDLRQFSASAKPSAQGEAKGYKPICVECYNGLFDLLSGAYKADDERTILANLQESQQLAIDLGTLIEQARGEGTATVACLEQYCEALYQVCSGAADMSILADCINKIGENLNAEILSKKEIVFLAVKPAWWHFFEPVYNQYINDPEWEVTVVSLPYFYKKFDGSLRNEHELEGSYPADVKLTLASSYDLNLHCPDIIVHQNSFDAYNPETSVMPEFYSDKLQAAAEKLIYIPPYDVEDFTSKNQKEYYNLASYLCMPGAIRADEIWVASETLRQTYVQKLTEFVGEEFKALFDDKLKLASEGIFTQGRLPQVEANAIVYYICASYLVEHKMSGIEKLKTNLDLIRQAGFGSRILFSAHPRLEEVSARLVPEVYKAYSALLAEIKAESSIRFVDITDMSKEDDFYALAAVYYGDGSHLAARMFKDGKPVMLQDRF